jgi:hypothetical protein
VALTYAGQVSASSPSAPPPTHGSAPRRRVRRPRLVPFLATGAILGFALGGLLSLLNQPAAGTLEAQRLRSFSEGSLVAYLGLLGAGVGLLLAGLAYLWADRRS